jgi:hypothetical protein
MRILQSLASYNGSSQSPKSLVKARTRTSANAMPPNTIAAVSRSRARPLSSTPGIPMIKRAPSATVAAWSLPSAWVDVARRSM